MDYLHVVILALIQGLTEFLPISSSAHLILPKEILGWPDQGLAFDVAVHVGTLGAVLIYFRHDVYRLVVAWFVSLQLRQQTADSRLGWYIIVATIPAGLAGLLFADLIETQLRSGLVIAFTTLVFGLALGWADWKGSRRVELSEMTWLIALAIGVAQALALVPGVSRSGITITMALLLGMQRESAARFSFLLSIPIILLSGGYQGLALVDGIDTQWGSVLLGVIISGISAYVCIRLFLGFIERIGMLPFVIYRVVLGIALGLLLLW